MMWLCMLGFCNRRGTYQPYPDIAPEIKIGCCTRCGSYDWR